MARSYGFIIIMGIARLLSLLCVLETWRQALGIQGSGSQPVILFKTNIRTSSRNAFSVHMDSFIEANAKVRITYPSEFTAVNLGIDVCVGQLISSATQVQVPCTVEGNVVTWILGTVIPGDITLAVENVRNPSVTGGTGNFMVELLADEYVLEVNNALGTVGITDTPVTLTSNTVTPPSVITEVPDQPAVINAIQTYTFRLIPSIDLPVATWLRMTFPPKFNLTLPLTCGASTGVSGPCRRQDSASNVVVIPGLTGVAKANSPLLVSVSGVKNPPITGMSGYLTAECLLNNTYTQLAVSTNIDGPIIEPGPVSVTSVTSSGLKQGQAAWYTLQFSTTNPVPDGGYLKTLFPPEFGGVLACIPDPTLVGLNGGPVSCNIVKDFNSALIGNFQGFNTTKTFTIR